MTIRVNREIVLKSLLNKVKEAKRLNMSDVKYPLKELEDLAYVVYQLMSEDISKILALTDPPEEKPKKVVKKVERKVLEEIREEEKPEPVKEEPKPKYEKYVPQEVPSPVKIDEEPEEDDDDNVIGGLYGGTW